MRRPLAPRAVARRSPPSPPAAAAARPSPRPATLARLHARRGLGAARSTSRSVPARPRAGARDHAGEKAIDRIKTEVVRRRAAVVDQVARARRSAPTRSTTLASASACRAARRCGSTARATSTLGGLDRRTRFELSVKGSGDVQARGRVDDLEVEVDGSRRRRPRATSRPRRGAVRIDGSGDAERARRDEPRRPIVEGSGDVTYRGRPRVSSRLDGLGRRARRLTATAAAVDPGRSWLRGRLAHRRLVGAP